MCKREVTAGNRPGDGWSRACLLWSCLLLPPVLDIKSIVGQVARHASQFTAATPAYGAPCNGSTAQAWTQSRQTLVAYETMCLARRDGTNCGRASEAWEGRVGSTRPDPRHGGGKASKATAVSDPIVMITSRPDPTLQLIVQMRYHPFKMAPCRE
ncbi:hypothetical protein B0H19DRAFT_1070299 [Mycena capillaripes]|nr:hypothetical protein B0H19DRAFT_1070299 [Mycena capillaripes]